MSVPRSSRWVAKLWRSVCRERFTQPRCFRCLLEQPSELACSQRPTFAATGKQPTLFRRLFLEGLTAAYQVGRLKFFGDQAALAEPARFKAYVAALRKVEWVVYAKRPFAGSS